MTFTFFNMFFSRCTGSIVFCWQRYAFFTKPILVMSGVLVLLHEADRQIFNVPGLDSKARKVEGSALNELLAKDLTGRFTV